MDRQSLLTEQESVQDLKPRDEENIQQESQIKVIENQQSSPPPKKRLNSLDVHRGLTMFGMILADDSYDDAPAWLQHAQWNGLTCIDLIFPSFVFIMGMAVPLAMSASRPFKLKNFIRIIALFAIGMALNLVDCKFDFSTWRFLGVLQRLSVCYGLISLLHVATSYGEKTLRIFGVLVSICIGLVYVALMVSFTNQSIGCTPEKNLTPFCNLGAYIDRQIFGEKHMYQGGPNDPESLFTNLSAYLNAFIGYYFCLIMMDNKQNITRILKFWVIVSLILGATVYPLTLIMPLCKKIWSISFVFVTCAVAGLSLAFLTYVVDVKGSGQDTFSKVVTFLSKPFVFLGRNPLAIYVLLMASQQILALIPAGDHNLWDQIYFVLLESWLPAAVASVVYGLVWCIILSVIAWIMFKKNIFIRL